MTTLFPKSTDTQDRWLPLLVPMLIALGSLAVSAFAAYSHNDKAISERVTAVEVKQNDDRSADKEWKVRVEGKLDHFIEYETGVKP